MFIKNSKKKKKDAPNQEMFHLTENISLVQNFFKRCFNVSVSGSLVSLSVFRGVKERERKREIAIAGERPNERASDRHTEPSKEKEL